LLNGWFIGRIGPRYTFLFAMGLFAVASVFTQIVVDFNTLVMARIGQGFAAGIVQPLAMTVLYSIFPMESRGRAMGLFSMGTVMAPAFGPLVGGLVIDNFGWQYLFTPFLPLCCIASALALHWLPRHAPEGQSHGRAFNWVSFILITLAIVIFLYALSEGQSEGWSDLGATLGMVISIFLLVMFVLWELHTPAPLLEVRLFANRTFAMSSIVGFAFGMGMFSSIYIFPLFVRTVHGIDATNAGLMMLPSGIVMIFMFPLAGQLAQVWPQRRSVMIGLVLFAVSLLWMRDADVRTGIWLIAAWITIGRMGLSMIMPALQFHSIRQLPPSMIPYGSGTFNFIRQLGGALGVNLAALSIDWNFKFHRDYIQATQTPDNNTTSEMLRRLLGILSQGGLELVEAVPAQMGFLARTIAAQAYTFAFQDTMLVIGIFFLLILIPAFFLDRHKLDLKAPPARSART